MLFIWLKYIGKYNVGLVVRVYLEFVISCFPSITAITKKFLDIRRMTMLHRIPLLILVILTNYSKTPLYKLRLFNL